MSLYTDPSNPSWQVPLETWELDALAALVERSEPQTEAEKWMRQRVLDAQVRKNIAAPDQT